MKKAYLRRSEQQNESLPPLGAARVSEDRASFHCPFALTPEPLTVFLVADGLLPVGEPSNSIQAVNGYALAVDNGLPRRS